MNCPYCGKSIIKDSNPYHPIEVQYRAWYCLDCGITCRETIEGTRRETSVPESDWMLVPEGILIVRKDREES